MKVALIGAGHLAWHLATAIDNAGYPVVQVYSRRRANAQRIADRLFDAAATDQLDFTDSVATLFVLCVADDALPLVLAQMELPPRGVLVHTSGTRALEDLQAGIGVLPGWATGVLYPLQTFSRTVPVNLNEVPLCIEASGPEAEAKLITLAQRLSRHVYTVNSVERRILHLAAVLASNFTNHLWAVARELLDEHELEFDLLKPLLHETFRKAMSASHPAEVQTGPARRHDEQTIRAHQNLLHSQPDLERIYTLLSRHIMKWYS
jgi:predicted short-subunit dehydrogenase-like oxidoreductase (DUF2520 family)